MIRRLRYVAAPCAFGNLALGYVYQGCDHPLFCLAVYVLILRRSLAAIAVGQKKLGSGYDG